MTGMSSACSLYVTRKLVRLSCQPCILKHDEVLNHLETLYGRYPLPLQHAAASKSNVRPVVPISYSKLLSCPSLRRVQLLPLDVQSSFMILT